MKQKTDWALIVVGAFVMFMMGAIFGKNKTLEREQRCTNPEEIMHSVSFIGNIPSYDVYRCDEGLRVVNVRTGQ